MRTARRNNKAKATAPQQHPGHPVLVVEGDGAARPALLLLSDGGVAPAAYLARNTYVTVAWTGGTGDGTALVPSSSVRLREGEGGAEEEDGRHPSRRTAAGRGAATDNPAGPPTAAAAAAATMAGAEGASDAAPAAPSGIMGEGRRPRRAAANNPAWLAAANATVAGWTDAKPEAKPEATKASATKSPAAMDVEEKTAASSSAAPAKMPAAKAASGLDSNDDGAGTSLAEWDSVDESEEGDNDNDSAARAHNIGPTHTLKFRRPVEARGSDNDGGIFPPTLFTDATYTRGILVPNNVAGSSGATGEMGGEGPPNEAGGNDDGGTNEDGNVEEVEVPIPCDYFAHGRGNEYSYGNSARLLPALTLDETKMWSHKNAAHAAAKRRFPMEVGRLAGTITLHFDERPMKGHPNALHEAGLLALAREYDNKHSTCGNSKPLAENSKFGRTVSKKQAVAEALMEMGYEEGTRPSSLPVAVQRQLEARSQHIIEFWNNVKKSQPIKECWNKRDGGFVTDSLGRQYEEGAEGGHGERHVSVACLLAWLAGDNAKWRKKKVRVAVTDRQRGRMASLYGGLRKVPTDATSVLEAFLDLSHPGHLYKVPLVTPYAVAKVTNDANGERTWRVRIGVYINRLLPEILTANTLHVVMSALDEGSYVVKEPLHTPPMRDPNNPVFQSSKYPTVRMPGEAGGDSDVIVLDDDDLSEEEEKKEEDAEEAIDAAVIGCSRESTTISPFTPRGLLKLMENTGNDISMWPAIAARLEPYLKLDLMLHQVHAVCWMTQMEHLGGFGINSILWEEREFLDGGSYFYSPALGQLRLGRPPKTVGGCCADEMGLGKTVQMLSLIASSLDELKREAQEGGVYHTHCTLIIVPPALARQWCNEVKKFCGDTLTVSMLDARSNDIDRSIVKSRGDGSDILVTTYAALEKPKTSSYLAGFAWGRIVLDEQQEIRSSTTQIAKNCENLDCHRRWMLSGTPIFEGVDDLRGELNFLRLEPYAAKLEDGFFDFSIMNHWRVHSQHGLDTLRILGLLILRRSKDMTVCRTGALIMEQKKLILCCVPVEQTASERALYCFLEYMVQFQLKQKGEDDGNTKLDLKSRDLCLRLLRQMCFSAVMMNGGLGVPSQLRSLNALMININRQIVSETATEELLSPNRRNKRQEKNRRMGCDDALRFLTQNQQTANVSDDFVTDVMVGQGGGVANRNRATESVEDKLRAAQEEVESETKKQVSSIKKRAKSYWQIAMEAVTTGALANEYDALGISPKFSSLWKWRALCLDGLDNEEIATLPKFLQRGWRPRESLARDLQKSNGFAWTHPYALRLDNIPPQVTIEEVEAAVFEAAKEAPRIKSKMEGLTKKLDAAKARVQSDLEKANSCLNDAIARDKNLRPPVVIPDPRDPSTTTASVWGAYVQLQNEEVHKKLIRLADSKSGIALESTEAIPHVEAALQSATEASEYAESQSKVYPCAANRKLESEARKALETAMLGLRIKSSCATALEGGSILLSRAMGPLRGLAPQSKSAMMDSCYSVIDYETGMLGAAAARIDIGRKTITRLQQTVKRDVSQEVAQMSAFETLEALREHHFAKTKCPICLCSFAGSNTKVPADPVTSMTSCGHFYCIKCLEDYVHRCIGQNKPVKCPECRKALCHTNDIILIDHLHNDDDIQKEKRKEAKAKVYEASKMLETSDGLIDGELWHSLFLAIDVPSHVSNRGHATHTALPRDFLSHMRAATGMTIDCGRQALPQHLDAGLSSKVQALLRDLPLGEHAVVFASSKEGVLHLEAAMKAKGIACFSLFVGQKTTEEAVSSWQKAQLDSSKTGPALIVQAGAAASGLTLTAASKMFIMEPFIRQEEEQQAYARCHRYGQKNDVCVKIYYAPVSVESRLLCWRKRAAARMADGSPSAKYVYTELFENDEEDADSGAEGDDIDMIDEEDDIEEGGEDEGKEGPTVEDTRRTQFLLGLVDEHGNPIGVGEDDQDDCGDKDRKISARRFVLG